MYCEICFKATSWICLYNNLWTAIHPVKEFPVKSYKVNLSRWIITNPCDFWQLSIFGENSERYIFTQSLSSIVLYLDPDCLVYSKHPSWYWLLIINSSNVPPPFRWIWILLLFHYSCRLMLKEIVPHAFARMLLL